VHVHDGLDLQQAAKAGHHAVHPAAVLEVLESVQRRKNVRALDPVFDPRQNFRERQALSRSLGRCLHHETHPTAQLPGINHRDRHPPVLPGRHPRDLRDRTQAGRDVDRKNLGCACAFEPGIGQLEHIRAGCSGRRSRVAARQARVEIGMRDLNAIQQALPREIDVQWEDDDAVAINGRLRQIAGAISDDADGHRVSLMLLSGESGRSSPDLTTSNVLIAYVPRLPGPGGP